MSLPRTYRVLTLGCKLNQFDSAGIEGRLRARGFRPAPEAATAGLVVINTCTVTANADREARRLARRARRENPDCRLLLTGCSAELDPGALRALGVADEVIGLADRERLDAVLGALALEAAPAPADLACVEAADGLEPAHFGERSRAFLKVQEGCDLRCSYCVIPRVRGPSRSVPPERLERTLASLVARGYREVVLTGVNTGDYGRDLTPRTDLASLLRRLLATPGLGRVRLNSLEPRTVTAEVVGLLKDDPRLARHLQVPLQSGSDGVLRRMRRNYRASDYARVVETLRREVPEIGLGADVIVGFPGETAAEFEETRAFLASSPLNYLHVFSYSDRPGTPAARSPVKTPPAAVHERSARLRDLGRRSSERFRRSFVGRDLPALVFSEVRADGRRRALTDNFIDLGLEADSAAVHTIVPARIASVSDEDTLAWIAAPEGPRAGAAGST